VLRLDTPEGEPRAVIYNFACHPIKGTPATGGNTADLVGFASAVIEENLGPGVMAFFLQGCGGDINPIRYKELDTPRDAEPLGNRLGLSTLRAVRQIRTRPVNGFSMDLRRLQLPRANHTARILEMEREQERRMKSFRGTTLNLKTFMSLHMKHRGNPGFPSADSYVYHREEQIGREDRRRMDQQNEADMDRYRANVLNMEALTRLMINKALLEKHQARNVAAGMKPVAVEVAGLRIGDFRLVTFPGEVTVPIGLNIKRKSRHENTFVAGYTNGYLYYCPTAEQARNAGGAQEDSDSLLAPEWQTRFEETALDLLDRL
jgi:hypothetical protein